jgi:BirA family biotin operon repressor/biotin-[acetyl-CoA-carboxylase] ligase
VTSTHDRSALDHRKLAGLLEDVGWSAPVPVILATTESTNVEVAALAARGAVEGTCVVAEEQTAGRGRQGRAWVSPPNAGLWMSVLVRPGDVPSSRWTWLPLLAGLAATDAIVALGRIPVALKWPNDLVLSDGNTGSTRKLGGILSEALSGSSSGPNVDGGEAIVIGIGVNVSLTAAELPTDHATSLLLEGGTTDREALLAGILRHLVVRLDQWRTGDPELAADYWNSCLSIGRIVEVSLPGGVQLRGEATGIDADGHLLIESEGKTVSITAGDVIHATI